MLPKSQILQKTIAKTHAVIVEIPRGYGFSFTQKQIAKDGDFEILEFLPRIHQGQKTEIINADDIDELREKLRGKSRRAQIVVFHSSEKMNETAQNKFLKLLEEPRENLKFALLTHSSKSLLETVRSRAQTISITPLSREESEAILSKAGVSDEAVRRQILFIAEGLPEEMEKLAGDKKYFSKKIEEINLAKTWVAGSDFDKITITAKIKNDREKALSLLENAIKILRATLKPDNAHATARKINTILDTHRKISANANVRLALTDLILKK